MGGELKARSMGQPGRGRQAETDAQVIAMWLHGKSANTIRAYAREARRFSGFAPVPLRSITLGDVQDYADHIATTDRIIHAAPLSLENLNGAVPKALVNVIDRLLRKNPKDRYPNPEALLSELRAIKLPNRIRPAKAQLRLPVRYVALALVVILSVFVFRWVLTRAPSKPSQQRNLVVLPFRFHAHGIE